MKYTIIIEKGRESGYVAMCPVLRGCVSQGKTRRDALKNLKEAMTGYIECLVEDGIAVPFTVDSFLPSMRIRGKIIHPFSLTPQAPRVR